MSSAAQIALLESKLRAARTVTVACDLFLSIGTSSIVYPAAALVHAAKAAGALTVEINPEATSASAEVDIAIALPAEEVLAHL